MITDEMRPLMMAIQAGMNHTRSHSSSTEFLVDGKWVKKKPRIRQSHSMFPYRSSAMAVHPDEVPEVRERLRKQGLFTEFDEQGRPIITSAKAQSDLAKALGMKNGRDGFGHTDEHGNFQNSGRRRTQEIKDGRSRVRRVIDELESMPEEVPAHFVDELLEKYDIEPNEDNTG